MLNGLKRAVEIIEAEIEVAKELNTMMAMGMLQANKLLISEIKDLKLCCNCKYSLYNDTEHDDDNMWCEYNNANIIDIEKVCSNYKAENLG